MLEPSPPSLINRPSEGAAIDRPGASWLLRSLCLLPLALGACGVDDLPGLSVDAQSRALLGRHPKVHLAPRPLAGRYMVTLSQDAARDPDSTAQILDRSGGELTLRFQGALGGFAARLSAAQVLRLADDPRVLAIEEDQPVQLSGTQLNPPWGLDRIDQHVLPADGKYTYYQSGLGVNAYVVDSGIRADHSDFTGRVTGGYSVIADGHGSDDCLGHGTSVASILGGITYGVAKDVTLVPVRVADCSGISSVSQVIQGLDLVVADHASWQPAVANLSFITAASPMLDAAIGNTIADGVTVVAAAGNGAVDACTVSPGRVAAALTVGATNPADQRLAFSNFGACVDLYAPGENIPSAAIATSTAQTLTTGTSAAAAHVAGLAALLLEAYPNTPPADVASTLKSIASAGVVTNAPGVPFLAYSNYVVNFPWWATTPGAVLLSGDFDGDGAADLALTGVAGWNTVPVAFSNRDGTFRVTNQPVASFATWAGLPYVLAVVGDINGDGKDDLALTGRAEWNFVPVAFSNGDGSFSVTARPFSGDVLKKYPILGDLDGDGKADLARAAGDTSFCYIYLAHSLGDGSFAETQIRESVLIPGLRSLSLCAGRGQPVQYARPNYIVSETHYAGVPVTYSNLYLHSPPYPPSFDMRGTSAGGNDFATWTLNATNRLVGDFNANGSFDIALVGGSGWATQPVLFALEGLLTNASIADFAAWAQSGGVKSAAGDFDGDGKTDLVLAGGSSWYTVPVAFSNGDGTFRVTNRPF